MRRQWALFNVMLHASLGNILQCFRQNSMITLNSRFEYIKTDYNTAFWSLPSLSALDYY